MNNSKFLALSFGVPFWATPVTAAMSAQLFARFEAGALAAWVIPCITVSASVTILLFGANSDLFGRRNFVLFSNLITAVGYAVCARATSTNMLIAGLCLNGCGSGIAGICLIAVPELMPNKYRHIGVVLADFFVYVMIIIGPVVGRFAILRDDDTWQWLYWAGFILAIVTDIGLFFLYRKFNAQKVASITALSTSRQDGITAYEISIRIPWYSDTVFCDPGYFYRTSLIFALLPRDCMLTYL
jgi:MFS family permease